jgi:hypothetical protein
MAGSMSTRFPPLPPETLRAKVAHVTIASCMVLRGGLFIVSSWDDVNCVAGEITSSGPCGVGLTAGGSLLVIGIFLFLIGAVVLFRALRRPVSEEAADGWRVGAGFVVMLCGALVGLLIPRQRCPAGTTLSPVFRFCVNQEVAYPAPSPGPKWKFLAFGVGLAIGVLIIRWRSMPIWLATVIVGAARVGTALFGVWRLTGIPGFHAYTSGMVLVTPKLVGRSRFRRGARPVRRPVRRS